MRVVSGRHAVKAALGSGKVVKLLTIQDSNRELAAKAAKQGVPVEIVGSRQLKRLAEDAVHQGVVALCAATDAAAGGWRGAIIGAAAPIVVVLDQVQDPRNLGACLRSAAAFGATAFVYPSRNNASLTPAARKAAAGGEEYVAVEEVTNLSRELSAMQKHNIRVIGAVAEFGADVLEMDLSGPVALVLGGEAKGLRELTRRHCDELATVPLAGAKAVASLNVSVACGIFLAAAARFR